MKAHAPACSDRCHFRLRVLQNRISVRNELLAVAVAGSLDTFLRLAPSDKLLFERVKRCIYY